jgi:hypothetical protein
MLAGMLNDLCHGSHNMVAEWLASSQLSAGVNHLVDI